MPLPLSPPCRLHDVELFCGQAYAESTGRDIIRHMRRANCLIGWKPYYNIYQQLQMQLSADGSGVGFAADGQHDDLEEKLIGKCVGDTKYVECTAQSARPPFASPCLAALLHRVRALSGVLQVTKPSV